MNRISALRKIAKKPLEKDARRGGVPVGDLLSRGLVVRQKRAEKRYLVPERAPSWASKFRYSRKKYGVEEQIKEEVYLKLTDRGLRMLKRSKLSKPSKDGSIIDDSDIIEIEPEEDDDDDD